MLDIGKIESDALLHGIIVEYYMHLMEKDRLISLRNWLNVSFNVEAKRSISL